MATNEEKDIRQLPAKHLLTIADEDDPKKLMQALDDWYLPANIKYEVFAQKYKLNGELEKQNGKIEEMKNWCDKMKIVATPTIFLNGYELPDAYGIEDLQYFLLE